MVVKKVVKLIESIKKGFRFGFEEFIKLMYQCFIDIALIVFGYSLTGYSEILQIDKILVIVSLVILINIEDIVNLKEMIEERYEFFERYGG